MIFRFAFVRGLAAVLFCVFFSASLSSAAVLEPLTTNKSTDDAPAGWVKIHSKGKSYLMGQEFAGHRWTYTFPVHPVSFTYDFMMSATAVTQAEFKSITGQNPTLHPGDENRPIDNVSWFDAVLYCNALSQREGRPEVYHYNAAVRNAAGDVVELTGLKIDARNGGYRLLSSAEFEYVVRAGTTTRWFFGDTDADQPKAVEYAWCDLNSGKTPHPVGQLKPNAFGVYDMTGNLWMWCNDWYGGAYPSTPQVDPQGPPTGDERVARGGAFKNDVNHERSAYHWQWAPQSHNFEVGFRIARTLPSPSASPLKLSEINEDAWYRIIASHSSKPLEIGGSPEHKAEGDPLQQNENTGADNQFFRFQRVQSGYYQIVAKCSGKALQIKDNSVKDHASIEQGAPSGADNQLFTLVKDTDDSFSIIAKSSGYGFDVAGGATATGNQVSVLLYPANNALNHKFKLLDASLPFEKPVVSRLTVIRPFTPPFDAAAAGLTPLFDGKTLQGWVADPEGWQVIDGAIVGVKGNQAIRTTEDYDDFRLIVSSIQVDAPTNHQGVGFWGERPAADNFGYGGCILVMPPMQWTWDYSTGRGLQGVYKLQRDLDKDLGLTRSEWTQAEILVNRAAGTVRMAVNGMEVLSFRDRNPARFKRGPICLQAHAGNKEVRYKDIYIEVAPKVNRLITLKGD